MTVKTARSSNHGSLAINLANTLVSDRPGRDLLGTPRQLREWQRSQGEWIDTDHASGARLEEARELRSIIRELLACVIAGRQPRHGAIKALNSYAALAPTVVETDYSKNGGFTMQVRPLTTDKDLEILGKVAVSAIQLFASPAVNRLGACAGDHCLLYFVARHPARRWCDSKVCGNRARVARHARRGRQPRS